MRMMLKASIPVDAGNAGILDGSLNVTMRHVLEIIKPEAAYFTDPGDGTRGAFLFFDMQDSSEIPAVCEPFFLSMKAKIVLQPAMNVQDLEKAVPGIERAVNEFAPGTAGVREAAPPLT
jgi:hypothetical protein